MGAGEGAGVAQRQPVLAAIGAQSVDEGQNLNFGVSATDADVDSLILSAENAPANATFTRIIGPGFTSLLALVQSVMNGQHTSGNPWRPQQML